MATFQLKVVNSNTNSQKEICMKALSPTPDKKITTNIRPLHKVNNLTKYIYNWFAIPPFPINRPFTFR